VRTAGFAEGKDMALRSCRVVSGMQKVEVAVPQDAEITPYGLCSCCTQC
jgi:hypothetical protein